MLYTDDMHAVELTLFWELSPPAVVVLLESISKKSQKRTGFVIRASLVHDTCRQMRIVAIKFSSE